MKSFFLLTIALIIFSRPISAQEIFILPNKEELNKYWYQQGAEISSFALKQHRYHEVREGYMVNVFVTEPFDQIKQVKSDHPLENKNSVQILKLNQIKKFNTGLYQYSLMTSSFTPFENQGNSPLKVSCSVQEWCGHVFFQFNQKGSDYAVKGFSYFESEGDCEIELKGVYLEDGIWNQIRINPNLLKTGEFKALPSSTYMRLMHQNLKEYKAVGTLVQNKDTAIYNIIFPDLTKSLEVEFEKNFPFKILRFTETYPDIIGEGAKIIAKNTGELKKTIYSPYWEKHKNNDAFLRKELLLDSLLK